jgi:hypothetical protein
MQARSQLTSTRAQVHESWLSPRAIWHWSCLQQVNTSPNSFHPNIASLHERRVLPCVCLSGFLLKDHMALMGLFPDEMVVEHGTKIQWPQPLWSSTSFSIASTNWIQSSCFCWVWLTYSAINSRIQPFLLPFTNLPSKLIVTALFGRFKKVSPRYRTEGVSIQSHLQLNVPT